MNWRDQLWWVFKTLGAQRGRSFLTVLGFAVGIAAVSLLSSIGEGLRLFVMNEFTQFGSHILAVTPGKTNTLGMTGMLNTVRPLSLQDAKSLSLLAEVEQVVPVVFGNAQVKNAERGRYTDVAGVGPDAAKAWKLQMAQGQFLPRDDWFYARPTAVLGHKLKIELFGNQPVLGALIQIGGNRYRVVGVTAPKGQFLGVDLDDIVYIPAARGLQLFNRESLMEVDIFYRETVPPAVISERVRQRLIQRHGLEDFTIITQDEMLKTLDKILRVLKVAAAGLGVISLMVGGVGILTILLITVRERRHEIGLLCALGFTPRQIKGLFLGEAVCLSLVGGCLGLGTVALLVLVARWLVPDLPLVMEPVAVFGALLLASAVGLVAGVGPAGQAARLKPIDALRAE